MFEEIIKIDGKETGPTSIILVGVHGDEKCGINALENILPSLIIEKGSVLFVYGNPRAIVSNERFTEINLNRMFKNEDLISNLEKTSYEYERAQFLKKYLNQASALLDIHASFTPDSKPFIICEKNAKEIIKYLSVDVIVSGFDQVEPGGTDYYMNSIGKIGICLECGYLGNSESTEIAEKNILAFLKARGHILNNLKTIKQSYIHMYDLYMTESNNFTLTRQFSDFEEISKNEILGIDGDKEIKAEKDSVILFARNRERAGEEAFLLGEKKNSLA